MTERQARDEGAEQTRLIVDAVKRLRTARGWSAQQLAEEMTKAGVPWNSNTVANLELGRRKSLRVHELLALLFVLDVDKPLEVLVPEGEVFPLLPKVSLDPMRVRAWLRGEGGPLRVAGRNLIMEKIAQQFEERGDLDLAAETRRLGILLTAPEGTRGQD